MIWVVGSSFAFGCIFCLLACLAATSRNTDNREAAALYLLPGIVLIGASVVLAIGNAAVKALL